MPTNTKTNKEKNQQGQTNLNQLCVAILTQQQYRRNECPNMHACTSTPRGTPYGPNTTPTGYATGYPQAYLICACGCAHNAFITRSSATDFLDLPCWVLVVCGMEMYYEDWQMGAERVYHLRQMIHHPLQSRKGVH